MYGLDVHKGLFSLLNFIVICKCVPQESENRALVIPLQISECKLMRRQCAEKKTAGRNKKALYFNCIVFTPASFSTTV